MSGNLVRLANQTVSASSSLKCEIATYRQNFPVTIPILPTNVLCAVASSAIRFRAQISEYSVISLSSTEDSSSVVRRSGRSECRWTDRERKMGVGGAGRVGGRARVVLIVVVGILREEQSSPIGGGRNGSESESCVDGSGDDSFAEGERSSVRAGGEAKSRSRNRMGRTRARSFFAVRRQSRCAVGDLLLEVVAAGNSLRSLAGGILEFGRIPPFRFVALGAVSRRVRREARGVQNEGVAFRRILERCFVIISSRRTRFSTGVTAKERHQPLHSLC